MAERMTCAYLPPNRGEGLAKYGRIPVAEIIADLRALAQHQLETAQKILAAKDEDFRVETYVGIYVRNQLEVLQDGNLP